MATGDAVRLSPETGTPERDGAETASVGSHTLAYLVARGVPGVVAFLAIPIFTNILEPGEYATYALVIAALDVVNGLLYQWIRLAIVRCYPADPARLGSFASTVVTLWLVVTAGTGLLLGLAFALPVVRGVGLILVVAWVLLTTQALFDLMTEYLRAGLRPWHFMAMQMVRAVALIGLGVVLLRLGAGWAGPLLALAVGMALAAGWAWRRFLRRARFRLDRATAAEMFRYGVPVSTTVALTGVIFLTDRALVAVLLGDDAAGVYSVAFDFTSQTVTLLMTAVSMAAFPIAVRALETRGAGAACAPMRTNAVLLLGAGVPVAVGAAVLAPGITATFFGEAYADAAAIIPWVGLSAVLAGLKAFHFDAALQFARRTGVQVLVAGSAVVVSVLLCLLLIPVFGVVGAGGAAALTYLFAATVTAWWGRRYFPLPFPGREATLILLAAAVMGGALVPFRDHTSVAALAAQIVGGGLLYGAVLAACDCHGLRGRIRSALGRALRPTDTVEAERNS